LYTAPKNNRVTRRRSLSQTYVLKSRLKRALCQLGADLPADCSISVVWQQQMICHPDEFWSVARQM